jgi:hypothetical protein
VFPTSNNQLKSNNNYPSMTQSMMNGWPQNNLFLAQKTQQEERNASFGGWLLLTKG